jgi:hypothetical protein
LGKQKGGVIMSERKCNFCKLLNSRKFYGKEVGVGTLNGFLIIGFVQQCNSFQDNAVKLFDQPEGGNITAVVCCNEIFAVILLAPQTAASNARLLNFPFKKLA